MSAPCSRCDCADFRGESGGEFCLACWHPRGAHHLLVCPECGATIEPVRIPLEAAAVGEGWGARVAEVHEQQVLWDSGVLTGADEDTAVTPIVEEPEVAAADGEQEGAVEEPEEAETASEDAAGPEEERVPAGVRVGIRARLRRGAGS